MKNSRAQVLTIVGILFLAAPFGAGMIRLVTTHHDLRYVWTAAAALIGAIAARLVRRGSTTPSMYPTVLATFFLAAIFAAVAAFAMGARAIPGVVAVAIVFGLCNAIAGVFFALARAYVPSDS